MEVKKITIQQADILSQASKDKALQNDLNIKLTTTDPNIILNSLPEALKSKGSEKLPNIINKQISQIKNFIIPAITNLIISKLNIRPIILNFIIKKRQSHII